MEQQILGQAGRMGEVLSFIPGMGELGAADGITDGIIEGTAQGFDGVASDSTDVVSSWGRAEGDAEPAPNFREAPPDEPDTLYMEQAALRERIENGRLEALWNEFRDELDLQPDFQEEPGRPASPDDSISDEESLFVRRQSDPELPARRHSDVGMRNLLYVPRAVGLRFSSSEGNLFFPEQ